MVLAKKIAALLFALLLSGQLALAAPHYDEEKSYGTGSSWWVNAADAVYDISDTDIAELVRDKNGTRVKFKRPGDVYITARAGEWSRTYLMHIKGDAVDGSAVNPSTFADEVLALVNRERAKAGAKPLRLADDLQQAAAVRAQELVKKFSHTRPDGSKYHTAIKKQGRGTGENIAAGSATPEAVVKQWMNSPGHRANILRAEYTELGVGYCYAKDSRYGSYWVQMFRR